jgi:hypothetical protein
LEGSSLEVNELMEVLGGVRSIGQCMIPKAVALQEQTFKGYKFKLMALPKLSIDSLALE